MREKNANGTREERKRRRSGEHTPRGTHGSFRSFLPFSIPPVRFFSPPWSLLTEERDVLLLSLIPRRRVRIRFSRQIPCLQAAATSLFDINLSPPSCTPSLEHRATASFLPRSFGSTRSSLCRRTIHGRTVFLA